MAAVRSKTQMPVGSSQWLHNEQSQALEFVDQEVEEFTFSARNEIEWLNEHMAEIFSQTQFEVAEIFKTPGKLRGKTPRTARKKDLGARAPLTDVFTSNTPTAAAVTSPARNALFHKNLVQFQVAEDAENITVPSPKADSRISVGAGKENTDSGYHDMTEEETDAERNVGRIGQQPTKQSPRKILLTSPQRQTAPAPIEVSISSSRARTKSKSNESFVSAEEVPEAVPKSKSSTPAQQLPPEIDSANKEASVNNLHLETMSVDASTSRIPSQAYSISAETASAMDEALNEVECQSPRRSPSPSDSSSPEGPSIRKKSSLTFASLPAREPLSKKSLNNIRNSRTSHLDASKRQTQSRDTQVGMHRTGDVVGPPVQSSGLEKHDDDYGIAPGDEMDIDKMEPAAFTMNSEETKIHNTTSTQRLQERITMLGKSKSPRPSKSIPSSLVAKQSALQRTAPKLPSLGFALDDQNKERYDDDWNSLNKEHAQETMQVVSVTESASERPKDSGDARLVSQTQKDALEQNKSNSGSLYPNLEFAIAGLSDVERAARTSISEPLAALVADSTTPAGSPLPSSKANDGPLSQSKAKLYSVLKSARGIFANSAGVSAQAKMEALSSHPPKHNAQQNTSATNQLFAEQAASRGDPQALYPELGKRPATDETQSDGPGETQKPHHASAESRGHDVANLHERVEEDEASTEKEREDGNEADRTVVQSETIRAREQSKHGVHNGSSNVKPQPSASGVLKQSEPRRPTRPTKEAVSKARPAPVSIKVRSQMIGQIGQPNTNLTSSVHESSAQTASSKPPTLTKKASNSSLHTTSSTQSFKTAGTSSSARPKALEAAARKKEQDEREAQRKAEQKKEMERKRAAKAEEEKKLAQEKALEQQRANEAHNAAQRQAAERRKAEAAKKNEQLRTQAAASKTQALEESVHASASERTQPQNQGNPRPELGVAPRPVSRTTNNNIEVGSRAAVPHINPAKPPKRQLPTDNEQDTSQGNFAPKSAGSNAQPQAKRRRTSEDELADAPARPTMGAPIRLSAMRKDAPNKFAHNFGNAHVPAHGGTSMLKTAVTAHHNGQNPKTPHINDLAKYSNARIPFAEQPNPPQGPSSQQPPSRMQPLAKTPATVQKSSPQYPNGDSIELPDIATDSEDSEDDDFEPPDWANSPALRELLAQQQLVDPMKVFGTIAPLNMEEVFKGNKERQAKFRNRTSSANWNGPDRLTEEERRKDREARERLEKEGAWTYGNSL